SLLFIWPFTLNLLIWSNDIFTLIGVSYRTPFWQNLQDEVGLIFWTHLTVSYLLVTVGTVLILLKIYRAKKLFRKQGIAILSGLVFMWSGSIISVFELFGGLHLHAVTSGFILAGVTFLWAIFRTGLTDITPIARSTILENMSTGVLVTDIDDRVIEINPATREVLDISTDERIVGRSVENVFSEYQEVYERIQNSKKPEDRVFPIKDSGKVIQVRVSPLHDNRQRQIGRLFLLHDITEQRRRQEELERQKQRLEEFGRIVSHDIRNPLNIARGNIELTLETGENKYLEKTLEALDRADDIIGDMLTLARKGQTVGETEETDLNGVVESSWENVDTRNADVETVGDLGVIEADEGRLSQMFENLFRNAVEHGGEDVTIRVGPLGDGFYVEDDGEGIPEDEKQKVFEHGYSTSEEGTGLGLSIVRSIGKAHGWDVSVTEGDDGGTRFEITGVN
ncbi:MAG: histidine kinase N-terminal 7TM domain-containing protein, partial [Halobacteria archaeon]|nr:histidine kinase N-terminal 7TM domain-containing protein [Halobacteria archaeon]